MEACSCDRSKRALRRPCGHHVDIALCTSKRVSSCHSPWQHPKPTYFSTQSTMQLKDDAQNRARFFKIQAAVTQKRGTRDGTRVVSGNLTASRTILSSASGQTSQRKRESYASDTVQEISQNPERVGTLSESTSSSGT